MVFIHQRDIDSEDGQAAFKQVQDAMEGAEVDKIEENGNILYKNKPLDDLVRPLLTSLKLEVCVTRSLLGRG
jgi:hypothetical protein